MRSIVISKSFGLRALAAAASISSGVALAAEADKGSQGSQAYQVRHEISWGMKYASLAESAKPE
ncbi:hypothetical protein EBZ80_10145, partial [bacterium]|nr:hypothetical protein [bacterium]